MIWRDDDISVLTRLHEFAFVHGIFQKYRMVHTIAVIAKDIEKNQDLVKYIIDNKKEFSVQLHCYEHFDHSKDYEAAKESLVKGKGKIMKVFGEYPTIWFPPWNSTNTEVEDFSRSLIT